MTSKKNKICIDGSQTERLLTDAYKMGKGIDDESICPTVKEMVEEHVPKEIRIGKAKKNKKESEQGFGDWLGKKAIKRLGQKIDGFF